MSKATIAATAFAFGLLCSALFTVAAPQKEQGPHIEWPNAHRYVFKGGGVAGGGSQTMGINLADWGAVPMFNSLDHLPTFQQFSVSDISQRLDGLNCEDCKFDSAVLSYGGGAVDIKGSTFSGTTELRLDGAAANTVALLELLRAIPKGGVKYKLPIPDKPIKRKATASRPTKMDFTAPYIGPR